MGGVDRKILENLIDQKIQIINDENFVFIGVIKEIFDRSVSILTDGNIRYLSFDRIKEIRPIDDRRRRRYGY